MRQKRRLFSLGALIGLALLTAFGASFSSRVTASAPKSDVTLTLYNAQHVALAEAWAKDFTAQTGIKVAMRSGNDSALANLLLQEGSGSPADVFITENSPAMTMVANAGLFAPVDSATVAQVPPQFASPAGDWVGIAARTTVFVYNTSMLGPDSLPISMMDLANPEWSGRFGIAPTGADFQAIVSAVLALRGPEATSQWLNGLKANARIYQGNSAIMRAANSGEIEGGIIYHYYWFGDRRESGANSSNVELHYFGNQDPGAFLSVSGGGVLQSSKYPAEAQQLLNYITSVRGQQLLSESNAMEYAIDSNVAAHPSLKPIAELNAPYVDLSTLNGPQVIELMQKAGLL
ncbi:MAG TPA: iron ABC transporter substrate-binding protein [Chloroflexota bacterium]|jgi:iron(III) transport system substrate-binding protein|nr:iron ABC transporter substrate-binding protein [Chloroflexota bacterium]